MMKQGEKRTNMETFWVISSSLLRCFRLGAIKFNLANEVHLLLRLFVFFMAFISLILFPWPDFIYVPKFACTLPDMGLSALCGRTDLYREF